MHSGSNADLEDFYRDFTPGEDMLVIDRALTNWTPTTDVTLNANFFVSSSTHADYVASNGDWAGVSGESMAPLVLDAEGNLYYDEYPHSGFGDTAEKIGHFSTVPDADSIVVATIHIDDLDAHLMVGDADYDFMIGLGGDDTLFGSGGSDTMYGGSGADAFKYTALSDGGQAGATGDKIIDFHHGEDYFTFTSGIFTVCDTVIAGDDTVPKNNVGFWTWGSAYDDSTTSGSYGDEGFIFDSNGDLWYDPNLGDMNDAVHIAHVEGEVTNEDIHLVP
ncbi:secreted mannuronan C-5 epimerase [Desulfovibrio ferrophilus]|uniref:Secreted mannuronan C-5 epimerase n=2 Tax=Desulfovibrio ferrophilus TaxID=241368 RepID=A0A2Z6AUR4_9BACT|nr:secreted mannuronan C-5 epimerase [Desulfovibrio ferrophilus]